MNEAYQFFQKRKYQFCNINEKQFIFLLLKLPNQFFIPRFREKWSKARKLEEAKRSKEEVKERERAERKRSKEVDKMMLFEEDRVVSDDKDF